jgi:hypothetical protein
MNTIIARNPFPLWAAIAVGAAVIIGFSRTYYLRFYFDLPPLARIAHIHGILSTLWIAMHYSQARLIATHRVALHKRLGIAGAILGAVIVIQAAMLSITGAAEGHAPPGRDPLQFMSVSLGTTFMFGAFLTAALATRRKSEWHKRLMLLTSLVLLLPAIGRIDGLMYLHFGTPRTVLPFLVTTAFVAWACMNDRRKRGNIHPAYLYGGFILLAAIPFRAWLGTTEAWMPFAQWVVR